MQAGRYTGLLRLSRPMLLAGLAVSHLYVWGLMALMVLSAGGEAPIWPFVGVLVALIFNLRLWRDLDAHIMGNPRLGLDERLAWRSRLKTWAPVSAPLYVWRYVR